MKHEAVAVSVEICRDSAATLASQCGLAMAANDKTLCGAYNKFHAQNCVGKAELGEALQPTTLRVIGDLVDKAVKREIKKASDGRAPITGKPNVTSWQGMPHNPYQATRVPRSDTLPRTTKRRLDHYDRRCRTSVSVYNSTASIGRKRIKRLKNHKTCTQCNPDMFLTIFYHKSQAGRCDAYKLPLVHCTKLNDDVLHYSNERDAFCSKWGIARQWLRLGLMPKATQLLMRPRFGKRFKGWIRPDCQAAKYTACHKGSCKVKKNVIAGASRSTKEISGESAIGTCARAKLVQSFVGPPLLCFEERAARMAALRGIVSPVNRSPQRKMRSALTRRCLKLVPTGGP